MQPTTRVRGTFIGTVGVAVLATGMVAGALAGPDGLMDFVVAGLAGATALIAMLLALRMVIVLDRRAVSAGQLGEASTPGSSAQRGEP